MSTAAIPTKRHDRSPVQFGLSTLLGLVAGCALLLAAIRWLDVLVLYLAFIVLLIALPCLIWTTRGAVLRWVIVGAVSAGLFGTPLVLEAALRGDSALVHGLLLALLGAGISGGAGGIKHKRLWWGLAVLTPSALLTFAFRPEIVRAVQAIVHWLDVLPYIVGN